MNMSKEKLMRLAERALKRTESYQWNRGLDVPDEENYKIDYLLVKGSKASPEDVVAYASFEDDMVRFHPLRENDRPFAHYGESSPTIPTCLSLWSKDIPWLVCRWRPMPAPGMKPKIYRARSNTRQVCRAICTTASSTALPGSNWPVWRTMTAWM